MDEYTDTIREALREYVGDGDGADETILAAHDRAVKAEAWDEAVEWAAEHARQIKAWRATGGHYTPDHEDEYNPYRDEATA